MAGAVANPVNESLTNLIGYRRNIDAAIASLQRAQGIVSSIPQQAVEPTGQTKRRGRPAGARNRKNNQQATGSNSTSMTASNTNQTLDQPKRRGRKPKTMAAGETHAIGATS